jgi:hypothetical protein
MPASTVLSDLILDVADSAQRQAQVLALQQRNLRRSLSPQAQARDGFVYVEHRPEQLAQMAAALPQAVALHGDQVVGYCLCMAPSMRAAIPALAPMFDQFDRMRYRGRVLAEWDYVVGGQVCVDAGYRGRGLVGDLYRTLRRRLPGAPELCVTEIAVRNEISRRAHYRIGFEAVERYCDHEEHWEVVAWAWQQDRAAE